MKDKQYNIFEETDLSEFNSKRENVKRKTHYRSKKRVKRKRISLICIISVIVLAICSVIIFVPKDKTAQLVNTSSFEEEVIVKTGEATILSVGDLLPHSPIIKNAYNSKDGTYSFDSSYTYLKNYVQKADYAVANLETTMGGNENGRDYSGYPMFNAPDSFSVAAKNAGFDMLLTANNHAYDTGDHGIYRTQQVIKSQELDCLGTRENTSDQSYTIKNINGLNFGFMCYTYETPNSTLGRKGLNGMLMSKESSLLINSFSYTKLDAFYAEVSTNLSKMRENGVDATIVYLHWGNEYQISEDSYQNEIAQKLCNLGVDLIIGGHPHVVQPIDLLTSTTDPNRKTVCVYSLGNALSNQRKALMNLSTGHTEDGLSFSVTFYKYSNGTVKLNSIEALPTWVNMYTSSTTGKRVYEIIPLDKSVEQWKDHFNLSDSSLSAAKASYDRTMEIIGDGIKKINDFLNGK